MEVDHRLQAYSSSSTRASCHQAVSSGRALACPLTSGIKMPATAAMAKRECTSSDCTYLRNAQMQISILQHAMMLRLSALAIHTQTRQAAPLQRCWVLSKPERVEAV